MNFLAHLWLADQVDANLAGAILGDLVRGRIVLNHSETIASANTSDRDSPVISAVMPTELARSILLHRRIDVRTDHHPRVKNAMAAFAPGARRYAGILLDLIYDHALTQHWQHFSSESLADFAARSARAVAQHGEWFAHAGSRRPNAWRFKRLLLSYRTPAGIDRAIGRTSHRLRQPQKLLDAAQDWPRHVDRAADDLAPLLQDLLLECRRFMQETAIIAL
jgi:acyl carrier protein phosphodiesterase